MAAVFALLVALSAVMALGWAFQRRMRNGGWTDVFWTFGTAAACVVAAIWPMDEPTVRQLVVAVLAGVWGLRLGLHIALRVARSPEDKRYAELREAWGERFQPRMLGFLLAQAPAGALLATAVHAAAANPEPFGRPLDYLGLSVALAALVGEATADAQLERFKAAPENRGRIADTGLWGWSRHPNYFFEWLFWVAYAPLAIAPGYPQGWWALAAPALMFVLLNYVTGVPPVERSMLRSRGEAFAAYQARTSRFIPRPPRPLRTHA